ncbi:TPA: hypothetical protein NKR24_000898 [Vibrio parahaemolyticus]|nr:hypothetical protein [Vibrio alginolyticus]HCH1693337.1 hypothetical protein [Vibrio parahaemolyticus]
MALLIDNDIVHKLAQLDLLEQAKPLLQQKYGELQVLNTLRFKYCPPVQARRNRVVRRFTQEVVDRVQAFIDSEVVEIDCTVTDSALIDAMDQSDDGLDIGEMQLLQALIDADEACMFTGDKRFLKALVSSQGITQSHTDKLEQSFVCFEQVMTFLIKKIGFEVVKQKYIEAKQSGLELDSALRVCFGGSGTQAQETVVQNNLVSHVQTLREDTERLLSTSEDWTPNPPQDIGGEEILETPL